MSFCCHKEIVSAFYPSVLSNLNRIEKISKALTKRRDPLCRNEYKRLIKHLVNLIPTYMLEGLASSGDSFLDKKGLDMMVENLNNVHLIRIVPHHLAKNVVVCHGMVMVSECSNNYTDMTLFDTITLDFLTEMGNMMIPYTKEDFSEFALREKWTLYKKDLNFDSELIQKGLEFIKISVAEKNAMDVYLSINDKKSSPFIFSAADFTCLLAKGLDFISKDDCSDSYAMGRLSESLFNGTFLNCLINEMDKRPKEIITMLSVLGKMYNAVFGDGSNINQAFHYYAILQDTLREINASRENRQYEYK